MCSARELDQAEAPRLPHELVNLSRADTERREAAEQTRVTDGVGPCLLEHVDDRGLVARRDETGVDHDRLGRARPPIVKPAAIPSGPDDLDDADHLELAGERPNHRRRLAEVAEKADKPRVEHGSPLLHLAGDAQEGLPLARRASTEGLE